MASTTAHDAATDRRRMRASDIVIDDERLSLAAKGAFVTIALLGNGCGVEELLERCRDGAGQVEAALQELVKLRYVRLDGSTVHFEDSDRFGMPEA